MKWVFPFSSSFKNDLTSNLYSKSHIYLESILILQPFAHNWCWKDKLYVVNLQTSSYFVQTVNIMIQLIKMQTELNCHGYRQNNALPSESGRLSLMCKCLQPYGLYSPWNSPGKNTGLSSLSLLQGIFPSQGSNPGLPHCRQILYHLSHKGSPRMLKWVAYPFSRGSSWSKNWTWVSCIAGIFFTKNVHNQSQFLLRCKEELRLWIQLNLAIKGQRSREIVVDSLGGHSVITELLNVEEWGESV